MSYIGKTMSRLSLILMLLLPCYTSTVQAAESSFQTVGEILSLNRAAINVGDHLFPIIPTVKVSIPGNKKAGLNDLKKGDLVRIVVQKYNDKFYVDTIYYLSALPTN